MLPSTQDDSHKKRIKRQNMDSEPSSRPFILSLVTRPLGRGSPPLNHPAAPTILHIMLAIENTLPRRALMEVNRRIRRRPLTGTHQHLPCLHFLIHRLYRALPCRHTDRRSERVFSNRSVSSMSDRRCRHRPDIDRQMIFLRRRLSLMACLQPRLCMSRLGLGTQKTSYLRRPNSGTC
jgi:hypothetical protein